MKKRALVLFDYPPPFGGVRVSASQLFEFLKQQEDIIFTHFAFESDTRNVFFVLLAFVKRLLRSEIVVFLVGDVLNLLDKRCSIYLLLTKLFSKKIVFKGFAGELEKSIQSLPKDQQKRIRSSLMKVDLLTVQTKKDYIFFQRFLSGRIKIEWLPNTRQASEKVAISISDRTYFKKACFVGKVLPEKGIDTILSCARSLPKGVSIDIYGPLNKVIADEFFISSVAKEANISYKGVIDPKDVANRIADYDALLLPSRWKKEGHPGVILEAFSVGVPVIASKWNAIPELVDENCGILIEPNSPEELAAAITQLFSDSLKWKNLSQGALKRCAFFDSAKWNAKFYNWIIQL